MAFLATYNIYISSGTCFLYIKKCIQCNRARRSMLYIEAYIFPVLYNIGSVVMHRVLLYTPTPTHTSAHIRLCISTHTYTYLHVRLHTPVHTYTHNTHYYTHMYIPTHTTTHTHTCSCLHTRLHTHVHTYTHVYTLLHIPAHTYKRTCTCLHTATHIHLHIFYINHRNRPSSSVFSINYVAPNHLSSQTYICVHQTACKSS